MLVYQRVTLHNEDWPLRWDVSHAIKPLYTVFFWRAIIIETCIFWGHISALDPQVCLLGMSFPSTVCKLPGIVPRELSDLDVDTAMDQLQASPSDANTAGDLMKVVVHVYHYPL